MTQPSAVPQDLSADRRLPANWAIWTQEPRRVAYFLLVDVAAVVLVASSTHRAPSVHELRLFVALAGLGIFQAELSRQIERLRRRINATPHINMSSVWTFAGVLLLPPVLIMALVVTLYTHLALRSWHGLKRAPAYKSVTNASMATLSSLAARGALVWAGYGGLDFEMSRHGWSTVQMLVLGATTYFVTAALIILPGLTIERWSLEEALGSPNDNFLEFATLCLGAVTAVLLVVAPEMVCVIIPPMLLLHRGVLVKQLEIAATTDDKTGVFNTVGWHHIAANEMSRASRASDSSLGILMIDLDRFKRVNDQHGHLAGDEVLRAVAATISSEVRRSDSVGRFGGEEFVVLLPGTTEEGACEIAERVRAAITAIEVHIGKDDRDVVIDGLSVSIGVAMYPTAGAGIERLLHAADLALYRAKTDGRNRVVSFLNAA